MRNEPLPMTDEEIVRDYRLSKNKAKQIGILANLNTCPRNRIIDILEQAGAIDEREYKPKRMGRPKPITQPDEEPDPVPVMEDSPEPVLTDAPEDDDEVVTRMQAIDRLMSPYIADLIRERIELAKRVDELDACLALALRADKQILEAAMRGDHAYFASPDEIGDIDDD